MVFNNQNKEYNASCDLFKNATKSVDSTETGMKVTFSNLVSTFGADWEIVATVLGLTGPNGRHFCPFCEVMLSNITKGVSHAPFLFQKYTNEGQNSPELLEDRTLERISELSSEFQLSGGKKETAKNYSNCEYIPLISEKGPLIKHVSVMLLHLSLGIGLQFINILENGAVTLDLEIRQANGLTSDGIIESYNKQHLLLQTLNLTIVINTSVPLKSKKVTLKMITHSTFQKKMASLKITVFQLKK